MTEVHMQNWKIMQKRIKLHLTLLLMLKDETFEAQCKK